MINFAYQCDNCSVQRSNLEMSSFVCECGGTLRLIDPIQTNLFVPYYSEEMKAHIKSPRDEARQLKKHGLSYLKDHKKLDQRLAHIRKNKEDVKAEVFAKEGIKYEKGSDTRFDMTLKRFVPKNPTVEQATSMAKDMIKQTVKNAKKSAVAASLFFFLLTPLSFAKIEYVDYTTLEINCKSYEVPKANKDYVAELYWLKKALSGDKEALEIFVGNGPHRDFFIGDEHSRWVRVYKDGRAEVTDYSP